jgi:pantetheine-phosphate adenylyltransferase
MRRAVCPGSYDPVTNGHVDIIWRASRLYDDLRVVVGQNQSKSRLFTVDERLAMLREATSDLDNVRVEAFEGLLVDYCRTEAIPVIVKGLRAVSDFEYELQMAQMNDQLAGIETVFLATNNRHSFLSSSLVKDVASSGGDVGALVPASVASRLAARFSERS